MSSVLSTAFNLKPSSIQDLKMKKVLKEDYKMI